MHFNDPTRHPTGGTRSPVAAAALAASKLRDSHRELLEAVVALRDWDGLEDRAGMDLPMYLQLEFAIPAALAHRLVRVADRRDVFPACVARFDAGRMAFDELAHLIRSSSQLSGRPLELLDASVARLLDRRAAGEPTWDIPGAIDGLVHDLLAPAHLRRQDRRQQGGDDRLVYGFDFDGGGFIHGEYGPLGMQTAVAAIEQRAQTTDGATRQAARAAAALDIFAESLGPVAADGTRQQAVPTVELHIDLRDATPTRTAQLLKRSGIGDDCWLTAATLEAVTTQAELIVRLRDGHRPLDELARTAVRVPTKVRRAVRARDRGCRAPGCRAPVSACHVHHLVEQSHGGAHTTANLALLCSFHHLKWVHDWGWTLTLDEPTGVVAWTGPAGHRLSTMPHGSRPPPIRGSTLPDWVAPPIPPPPDHP